MRVGWRYVIQGSGVGVIQVTLDTSGVEIYLGRIGGFMASGTGIGFPDLAFRGP